MSDTDSAGKNTGEDGRRIVTDGGIDATTLTLTEGMEGAAIHADTAQTDIEIAATDAELHGLLDELIAYFEGGGLVVGDKWQDNGGEQP